MHNGNQCHNQFVTYGKVTRMIAKDIPRRPGQMQQQQNLHLVTVGLSLVASPRILIRSTELVLSSSAPLFSASSLLSPEALPMRANNICGRCLVIQTMETIFLRVTVVWLFHPYITVAVLAYLNNPLSTAAQDSQPISVLSSKLREKVKLTAFDEHIVEQNLFCGKSTSFLNRKDANFTNNDGVAHITLVIYKLTTSQPTKPYP